MANPSAPPGPSRGYTVLARRYRPQNFEQLVGQQGVARALTNALKGGRVAHAYLFTGSRGVGKTSTARILAKALNCEKGPTPTPCGVCGICKSITAGEDVDVLEIDGASNRRIDEIRDIRSNVQFKPARARYKIYIIDEVHMLTKEAFNALLKTLEEPPPHVKFLFATTEVDKVPITILSRCQRFDFAGIPLAKIVERLQGIVAKEGIEADAEALELLARRAGGSMRDAQSLLDQLLAFGGEKLTAEQVHTLLGTAGDDRVAALAEAVVARDAKQALELLDDASVAGLQLGELLDQLINYWRDLMVAHCAGAEARDLSVPSRLHETLTRQAKALPLDTILAGLDILSLTKARLRGSSHGRVLVEMALVRMGRLQDLVPLSQLTQLLADGVVSGGEAKRAAPTPAAPARAARPETGQSKPAAGPAPAREATPLTERNLPEMWERALATLGPVQAAAYRQHGSPAISAPNTLVLRIAGAYNAGGKEAQIEKALRELTGEAWTYRVETGPEAEKPAPQNREKPAEGPRRGVKEEAEKQPLIRRAMDRLGATVQRVDPGFGEAPSETEGEPPGTSEEGPRDV